jgi:hypothetical protein
MNAWRNGLITGLLLIACLLGLQVSCLLVQASLVLANLDTRFDNAATEATATLQYSQAVLASVRGTTETVRKSAVQQMGYYEAVGRRSALALAHLDLLISHTDARMERITQAIENTSSHADESLVEIEAVAGSTREDLGQISERATELMSASTTAVQQLDARLADDRIDQIASSLAQSSQNTAQATANMAEATGYVRDMLSPAKKSFWRRLLELMIPRPTMSVP